MTSPRIEQPARPPGRFELTLLAPGDEARLALGRIRLDPSGYFSDRATGREIVPRGEAEASFEGCRIERLRPHHYRIETAAGRTVLLRYSHGGWYHHEES